jgi:hypothetical protein
MAVTGPQPRRSSPPAWPGAVSIPTLSRPGWRRARRALLARWHADALDHELAGGVNPRDNPLLAMRAHQLTTRYSRRQLAGGLARAQRDAGSELSVLTTVVAPDRYEVLAAVREMAALERRLRDDRRVDPAGAAMLRLLLSDATSPLYDPVGPGSLARHLRGVTAALEPRVR